MSITRRQLVTGFPMLLGSAALLLRGTEANAQQVANLPLQWNFNERLFAEHETAFTHEDWEPGVILPSGMTIITIEGNLSTARRRDPSIYFEGGWQRKWPDGVWRRFFFFTFVGGEFEDPDNPGQFLPNPQPHVEIANPIDLPKLAGYQVRGYMTALTPGRYSWRARIE